MNESAYRINNEVAEFSNLREETLPVVKEPAVHLVDENNTNKDNMEIFARMSMSRDEKNRIIGIIRQRLNFHDDVNSTRIVELVEGVFDASKEYFLKHPEKLKVFLCGTRNFQDEFYFRRILDLWRSNQRSIRYKKEDFEDVSGNFSKIATPLSEVQKTISKLELEKIIENISDEKDKKTLAIILGGIMVGNEILEILADLKKKGLTEGSSPSYVPVTYTKIVKKYLLEKFPNIPRTLGDLKIAMGEKEKESKKEVKKEQKKEKLEDLTKGLMSLLDKYKSEELKENRTYKEKLYFVEYFLGVNDVKSPLLNIFINDNLSNRAKMIKLMVEEDLGHHNELLARWNRDKIIEIYNDIKNKEAQNYEK